MTVHHEDDRVFGLIDAHHKAWNAMLAAERVYNASVTDDGQYDREAEQVMIATDSAVEAVWNVLRKVEPASAGGEAALAGYLAARPHFPLCPERPAI